MTTRIEIGGQNLSKWLKRHHVESETADRFTVAEVADEAGEYMTAHGNLGIEFTRANNGQNFGVTFDCRDVGLLQGRRKHSRRDERTVHVDRFGDGWQQLATGVDIFVSTGASRSEFRERRR